MANLPRRIGKFEILERLGEGGMGEVFLARDAILGREVALKIIRSEIVAAGEARERFFREAQASGRLNHPNLVTVHEFGEDQGIHYLAMEFVQGQDLAHHLAQGAVARGDLLELLAQVCDGLAYAHQRGILHRDIKPSNIRITRISGRLTAKVLDFGIARVAGSDLTASGALVGTFGYLAPESIKNGKPDQRADLFAVGVILYEALAGLRPFEGESTATVLHRIVNEEPAPLDSALLEGISPAIRGVVAKALAKDPAARYATAEALAADLRAARNPAWDPAVEPVPVKGPFSPLGLPGHGPQPGTPLGRKAWLLALIPLVLAGAAGGAWAWRRHRHRPMPAPQVLPQPSPQPIAPPPAEPAPQPAPDAAATQPAPSTPAPQPAPVKQEAAKPATPPPAETHPAAKADVREAAQNLEGDPKAALAALDKVLAEDPTNERAMALRIVALYDLHNYLGCAKAMVEARTSGHPLWPMALKYPRLRRMLEQERDNPHLPRKRAQPQEPK
jgi:serine/threonine-protein kinase